MNTVEVPRAAWAAQLNDFTAAHEGWPVSLDIRSPSTDVRGAIEGMPLLGISIDHAEDGCSIAVSVSRSRFDHLTHVIDGVTRVLVQRTDEGADAGVRIDSAGEVSTVLRLRNPVLPERVDHVLHR
jgi:hypothetical protein